MYIRCKDEDSIYIIDRSENKVYEIIEGSVCLMRVNADNFMRFNPYLEPIEETDRAPIEIVEYEKFNNAPK